MKTSRLFSGYWLNTRAPTKASAASSGTSDRMVTKASAEAVRRVESSSPSRKARTKYLETTPTTDGRRLFASRPAAPAAAGDGSLVPGSCGERGMVAGATGHGG